MNEGTRKIIAVTPEESSLVRAGTVIMDDAMARKKKSEEVLSRCSFSIAKLKQTLSAR